MWRLMILRPQTRQLSVTTTRLNKLITLERETYVHAEDEAKRLKFYRELIKSKLYACVVEHFETQTKQLKKLPFGLEEYIVALLGINANQKALKEIERNYKIYSRSGPVYPSNIKLIKFTSWIIIAVIIGSVISSLALGMDMIKISEKRDPVTSDVKFADIKGCDDAKQDLEDVVRFLKDPKSFNKLGGSLPKGVLLTGPPGTGKTLLAKAVAGEAGVTFFNASGSEFEEMYIGLGAKRIRELFQQIKNHGKCVLFIDEIDAIGGTRKMKDMQGTRMTLNQLLVEMDGFDSSKGVVVIGATNFPELLDLALLRPGRFDLQVFVPFPDLKGREEILNLYLKKIKVADDVKVDVLARGTPGCSGADLSHIVNTAAIEAVIRNQRKVSMQLLEFAKDKVLMGVERALSASNTKVRNITAYHEGGHAIVSVFTSASMPIHKATILPRGNSLGMVMRLPEGDQFNKSKEELLADLDVAMGGRVAESLVFGDENVTTGASSDIVQASKIARAMVTHYGMSEKLGPVQYSEKDISQLSQSTLTLIDQESQRLLSESYERVKQLLTKHRDDLDKLAKNLLIYETLSGEDIYELLGVSRVK